MEREKEEHQSYKIKYSTKKNGDKFRLLRNARIMLSDGVLSQESYDLFVSSVNSKDSEYDD
jgi:hypothetical protein